MAAPDIQAMLSAFRDALAAATTPDAVEAVRREHSGKKSALKAALKSLRDVPADERPAIAAALNEAAAQVDAELEATATAAHADALNARLDAEWQDLSMPGIATERGARHPLTDVERQSLDVLRQLGFNLVDGPEVEHPFYNFDALNIPEHHPARDMQDTFWVQGGWLLRSHTTTVQARVLEQRRPLPLKIASAGRVYRNEAVDATHLAMFHQLEGLWVDHGLTFGHLKGLLAFIARSLYGDRPIRFKPKFYPYTEPSVGVDLQCGACAGAGTLDGHSCPACHGAGWVTILGAGMVHPAVFETFGYAWGEVSGIAFGLGTTRMASQRAGVRHVKRLYDDPRVLVNLHRGSHEDRI